MSQAETGDAADNTGRQARDAAAGLVAQILDRRTPLDQAMERSTSLAALEPRDRGFARLLLSTTLRHLGQIDDLLARCIAKPLPPRARPVQHLLRLGVAQLLLLDTPPHAAVDTTVDLAGRVDGGRFRRLANGVMRRLDREGRQWLAEQDAARLNLPDWLWESWCAAYGEATTRAIAAAHLHEAPLDLSVKPGLDLAERLQAARLPTGTLRRPPGGDITALPGFVEGEWWVQDAAAAIPVGLLPDPAGRRVVDIGAAPGGKTAQLAALGARVTAVDISAPRQRRLHDNLMRLGLSAEVVTADAAKWQPAEPFDAALLDVPCSATGTIRRHPDVPFLKRAEDVERLAAAQDRLLRAAVAMTRPGSHIVYACCSLQPEEGQARIDALLAEGAPVARMPVTPEEVGGMTKLLTPQGDVRTLPCHLGQEGGMDGFFVARLRRTG